LLPFKALPSLKGRLLLRQKGAHAFLLVRASKKQGEQTAAMGQTLIQGHLECRARGFFDEARRDGGLLRHLLRQLLRRVEVLSLRDHTVDHAPVVHLLRRGLAAREAELQRAVLADGEREE